MLEKIQSKLPTRETLFSRKVLAPVLLGAVAIGTVSLASTVEASSSTPFDSLTKKIAEKFNLSESDVKAVFEEQRAEMKKEHQAKQAEELQTLVDAGKITSAQKDALIAKMQGMHEERESNKDDFQNMTKEERQKIHETRKAEMDQWLKDQGIDKSVLEGLHGPGKGMKGDHHRGM